MFQDVELHPGERGFKTVGETDEESILIASWRASDDTNGAARMNKRVVGPTNFDQRHDLCPCEDVVRLMRHSCRHDNRCQGATRVETWAPWLVNPPPPTSLRLSLRHS